jgi:sugar transferase (PEP-CTERM/EpsH1 system associated)
MQDQHPHTTVTESTLNMLAHTDVGIPSAIARSGFDDHCQRSRVVHVSLGTDVGGMEKMLVDFARFVDRKRFELAFVSLQKQGKLAAEIENLQWPVYALGKPPGLRPGLVVTLARRLRRLRADVVHTHNTAAFLYGVMASSLARVPRIIHTRHGQRFDASRRETFAFRMLSKLTYRMVSVSEDGRQLTVSEGVNTGRACLIRNGVDLGRFPYAGPNEKGPAVLVARLSPEKDVATLIHAMKHVSQLLRAQHPALDLEIVGDGATRPQLESLSQSLGLGSTIRFLGERNDIPGLLGNASMFVLPSLTEGISLTLLEAMARGLPVVATEVGGNPEVVENGKTGFLVPAQDPQALAQAMSRIHRDPKLGREMGICGRSRVEAKFSVQRMVREYEGHYVDGAPR